MAKEYDKNKIKRGIIEFSTALHVLDKDKSIALLSCPFPAIKALDIEKDSVVEVRITKKKELSNV